MQAELIVKCGVCGKYLGKVPVDTADNADKVQEWINKVILAHRQDCRYYRPVVKR
ncbi:hypothetical protein ES705_31901 [subsurface metagenome]